MKEYKAGTPAVLDSHYLIPVKVIQVIEPGTGRAVTSGRILVKVMKTIGGYFKDEIVTRTAHAIVPVKHLVKRQYSTNVNTEYAWVV